MITTAVSMPVLSSTLSFLRRVNLSIQKLIGLLFILVSILWFATSCQAYNELPVVIRGSGFSNKLLKIYLTKGGKIIDSTNCSLGKFEMYIKNSGDFEPFLASLCYFDGNGRLQPLSVRHEIEIKKDGKNHSYSSFMLDYGTTTFTYYGNMYGVTLVNIEGGREEHLLETYSNLGVIGASNNITRKKRFEQLIEILKDNSYSYYLLVQIIENRTQYSKAELQFILDIFDTNMQNSNLARRLKDHISNTLNKGENTRSLNLISNKKIRKKNINKTANLNMLIFWASWFGPCRMEIPELKKIHQDFKGQNIWLVFRLT